MPSLSTCMKRSRNKGEVTCARLTVCIDTVPQVDPHVDSEVVTILLRNLSVLVTLSRVAFTPTRVLLFPTPTNL